MEVRAQIARSLASTLSSDSSLRGEATEALDRFSLLPGFPLALLSVAIEGENQGQKVAAATYLKNFTRRNIEGNNSGSGSKVSKEFKDQLLHALLRVEPSVLKVLIETFRIIVSEEVVKQNSWPELVPDLRSAIQNSNLFSNSAQSQWNTVNALTVLHSLLRPFQYFLDPKVAKEPVPLLLELIAKEILVPLLDVFHQFVKKDPTISATSETETSMMLLLIGKCMYFSVKSHMPSALAPLLPSFCHDLIAILGSLSFDCMIDTGNENLLRLKTGKRSLKTFCALVTRHRKYSDKLMPDMINSALSIVKYSKSISKLEFLSERIVSLAFDVISHVLETGPGWRLVSPHFSFLLESAIFPTLVMNEKDISEWEEDADEFIRKNLPSDLEEVSGWREDLFTARKSAINLLAVISMSKGPPSATSSNTSSASSKRKKSEKNKGNNRHRSIGELLVLPFLSKFPIPSEAGGSANEILNNYFGVLMGYGGLLDYLREQEPRYTTTLVQTRILPLNKSSVCLPFLVAPANWVIGELASCLPEDMSADIYTSLLKALTMPDSGDTSCYPVRVSAAGAIMQLLENEYFPPDWLPLLQAVIGGIGNEDDDNSILFQLLSSVVEVGNENVAVHIPDIVSSLVAAISKSIPASPEPWPQMVEKGFAALAVMAESWESFISEENEQKESNEKWTSGQAAIGRAFSGLLQQAWLKPSNQLENEVSAPSCVDDASTLLRSIMLSVSESNAIQELKISELLLVWAGLIADWHAWEESEDMSVFDCIQEVINMQKEYGLKEFFTGQMPSPNPPVPAHSIIGGIGAFVHEAISQYPSATWRACSCVHMLLHVPNYSFETDNVKQSLSIAFCGAAFSRFKEIRREPCSLWKPLLLAIASCYVCCPEHVERILEKEESGGFTIWVSALRYICSSSYEPGLTMESEIKLIVMALAKVLERVLEVGHLYGGLLHECYTSLLEASVRLKEMQDEEDGVEEDEDDEEAESGEDNDDETEDDDDEDSEADEHEETEEEFLNRYAKAAGSLLDGTDIEEGDEEDQDHEVELGSLESVDTQRVVLSLLERHHQVLRGQPVSTQLVSSFLAAFPECNLFQQSMSS